MSSCATLADFARNRSRRRSVNRRAVVEPGDAVVAVGPAGVANRADDRLHLGAKHELAANVVDGHQHGDLAGGQLLERQLDLGSGECGDDQGAAPHKWLPALGVRIDEKPVEFVTLAQVDCDAVVAVVPGDQNGPA